MMKLFLAALTISGFSVFGISCGSAGVQEPATAQTAAKSEATPTTPTPARETVTLTSEHPTGSFPLPPDILQTSPSVLEVSVTKVVNPNAKSVSVFVYLSPPDEKDESQRVEVGNFSLYPTDRPAKFLLAGGAALRKLPPPRTALQGWRVVFELDKQTKQESSLELTIESPKWKTQEL
jgi:hypothetical protein